MKRLFLTFVPCLILLFIVSCEKIDKFFPGKPGGHPGTGNGNLPTIAYESSPEILLTNSSGYHVYNGGYGSAVSAVSYPGKDLLLYYLTDRGPNVAGFGGLYFIVPDYNPQIGVFKLDGDSLRKIYVIHLKNAKGKWLTGLPNPADQNPTGEVAYDANGNQIPYDPDGIDSEGLAVMDDGSFWVSDEYGPHIVHFDANGNQLERISPFQNGTGNREIPKVFMKRRANRGMEGLAIAPDNKWLAGAMQSPLDNPSNSGVRNSRVNRLLFFNIETGATKQFIYRTEVAGNYISEIVAINNTDFLVLERDSNFPLAGNPASSFKRVYRISIVGASDVSDPSNGETGMLINGKTLESAAADNEPGFTALNPVTKSLAIDIIATFPNYPHDKTEGIALIGKNVLAISNDPDFGVLDDGAGGFMPKYLPFYNPTQVIDRGETYFVKLPGL